MEYGCMKLKNTVRWRKTSIKAGDVRDNPYDPLRITISERTEQNKAMIELIGGMNNDLN